MSSIEKLIEKMREHEKNTSAPVPQDHFQDGSSEEDTIIQKGRGLHERNAHIDLAQLSAKGMVTVNLPNSQIAEEYRNIKRPLLNNAFSTGSHFVQNGNLVMITSSVPGEGKTFTTINLAMSIAMEMDRTVLLIDADVSKGGICDVLGINPGIGLSDLLNDSNLQISDAIIHTNIPKLRIISAGSSLANMTELYASENMERLVKDLAGRYPDRIILFDSPPLLVTSEARVIATLMGQILLVVEAEKTPQNAVQESVALLDRSKSIGIVLNKSFMGMGKAYGYGYGYGYGKK